MGWREVGRRSGRKGKRGERELARWLRRTLRVDEAERAQQYSGAAGDADLVGLPGLFVEAKSGYDYRTPYRTLEKHDVGEAAPVAFMPAGVVFFYASDLAAVCRRYLTSGDHEGVVEVVARDVQGVVGWVEKARAQAPAGEVPVIFWRATRAERLVVVWGGDLGEVLRRLHAASPVLQGLVGLLS